LGNLFVDVAEGGIEFVDHGLFLGKRRREGRRREGGREGGEVMGKCLVGGKWSRIAQYNTKASGGPFPASP